MSQTQTRKPLEGVIFDMDGTLNVPNLDFKDMYRRAGVPEGEDILSDKWRSDATASAVVKEMEAEGMRTMKLMPGAGELGAWLAAHGIPMALVTRNSSRAIGHFHGSIWPTRLPPLAPAISRDDPYPAKPDPSAMTAIAGKWGVALGRNLLMVGDSPRHDIAFGKASGVQTALLDTNHRNQDSGTTGHPDFVVDNLAELAAVLWRRFDVSSPLTCPALHTKRVAPTPSGEAALAIMAGDVPALTGMSLATLSAADADMGGQTPLVWAADVGNLQAVQALLEAGVDVDTRGYRGATAVSRAACRGHTEVLAALLTHGADAQIANNKLQFPLHFAAFKCHPQAVGVLLDHGANPLVLDRKGRTPAEDTSDQDIRNRIRCAQAEFIRKALD